MTQYTKEKKEHALTLMSVPQNKPVSEVAKLTGIPGSDTVPVAQAGS